MREQRSDPEPAVASSGPQGRRVQDSCAEVTHELAQ